MSWIILFLAGLLEVGWTIGLRYTVGFTKFLPTVMTVGAMIASMVMLGVSTRQLPVGTAYAVWVGIGSVGTVTLGIMFFGESASPARLLCLVLIVAGVVGLKVLG